jgi:hypothetical protein
VIDERTGDVTAFGPVGAAGMRVTAGLWAWGGAVGRDGVLDSASDGYVEARDEQTWQYLGRDAQHAIGWRKVYCLEGDRLYASFLVQNLRTDESITCGVLLSVDPPADAGRVRAFNEVQGLRAPDGVSGGVVGDVKTLKPGERLSFTTAWELPPK